MTQAGDREAFRRAFAAATVHDMFNWLSVIILTVIELATGFLEKSTEYIVDSMDIDDGGNGTTVTKNASSSSGGPDLLKPLTKPLTNLVVQVDKKVLLGWSFQVTKSILSKNSHFQHLIFHKIHIFKISFFTKFTFQVNSQGNVLFLEDSEDSLQNLSFLTSLSLECPSEDCHPEARKYLSHFSRHKEELLQRLFTLFNQKAFNSALPKDLVFAWNPRLTKTAGVCINRKIRIDNAREERISKIELSSKVIDCAERLRDTLLHELCHAMTWIRHGVRDGHGQFFRYFAQEAMKSFPQIEVTRCHR